MDTWHIYPADDSHEHDTEGYDCHCDPEVNYDQEDDVVYVLHNSFDGRELVEEAKRILDL